MKNDTVKNLFFFYPVYPAFFYRTEHFRGRRRTRFIQPYPPPAARNKILHIRYAGTSGLGNRLKKTISYLRYHRPRHLNLYWPAEGWVSARFSDLFRPEWPVSITEYNNPALINNFPYGEPLADYVSEYALLAARSDFHEEEPFMIDGQYHRIPESIKQTYIPYFTAIKPSPAVQKRISSIPLPDNVVAVQIRNAPDWEENGGRNEPLETYFAIMDGFPADTVFFLSAMNASVAASFYQRYPGRITELPGKDYGSMVDAAADMFLLGRASRAVYAYGSTFSEVGWWLGGAKTDVIIAGSTEKWQLPPEKPLLMLDTIP